MKNSIKNTRFYLWTAVAFALLSLAFKLYIGHFQSVWIDEQYSVAFAVQNSAKDLLLFFNKDVHPGGYYTLLKLALNFTQDIELLRLITSIVPQTIGLLAVIVFRKTLKLSSFFTVLTVFLLSFNPFFNYTISQLRTYGLVFLFTVATHLAFQAWKKNKTAKNAILLAFVLAVGNTVSYGLFILSAAYIGLIVWKELSFLSLKKKVLFSLLGLLMLTGQFVVLSGFEQKMQFAKASWIAAPTLHNIPNLYLTGLGLESDINTLYRESHAPFVAVAVLGIIGIIFQKKTRRRQLAIAIKKNRLAQEALALIATPFLIMLLASWLLPFLAERAFLYQFVPSISLFLPRTQLPFFVLFFLYLPYLLQKMNRWYVLGGMVLLLPAWGYFSYELNTFYQHDGFHTDAVQPLFRQADEQLLIWPAWFWYKSVSLHRLDQVQSLDEKIDRSYEVEQIFWDRSKTQQEIDGQFCSATNNATYLIAKQVLLTPEIPIQKLYASLESCCTLEQSVDHFEIWRCQEN